MATKLNRVPKIRKAWRRQITLLSVFGSLIGGVALSLTSCGASPIATTTVPVELQNVIDGDTLQVKIGAQPRAIRIHGIDTPEARLASTNWEPTSGAQKKYADEATAYARTIVENAPLTCQIITSDRYDRIVARVFAQTVDLAIAMVRSGLARVFYISIDPNQQAYYTSDSQYVAALYEAQADAYINHRGFWSTLTGYSDAFPAR